MRAAIAFGLCAAMAAPVGAHPVATAGATLSCGGLHVWVGAAETWADHGVTGAEADTALVHVQMVDPASEASIMVDHMPFEAAALHDCEPVSALRFAPNADAFLAGYELWRAAVADGGAGAFGISPREAYEAVISTRNGG